MKYHNKFSEDKSIAKVLSDEKMFGFSDIVKIQGENERVTEKNTLDGI